MDKRGEKLHILFMNVIFFSIFVFVIFLLLQTHLDSITGFATYDSDSARTLIEDAFASSAELSFVESADMCFVIPTESGERSLRVQKEGDVVSVSESTGFCTGLYAEDVVIKFRDYDSFVQTMSNPSPSALAAGAGGNDFYILESKFVQTGGDVVCNAEFKVKYCDALANLASPEQLIDGDMACCLGELTKSQKALLDEHLAQTGFVEESARERSASSFMDPMIIGLAGGAFIVVILVLLVVTMLKPHKKGQPAQPQADPRVTQLKQYIQMTKGQGFNDAQIREHLAKEGWTPDVLDKAFQPAPTTVVSPPATSTSAPQGPQLAK